METATDAARPDAMGFVLAGGESRRMGQDKALIEFAGRRLLEQALGILKQAGLDAAIACGHSTARRSVLEGFAPVVEDGEPGRGPLAGICASLAFTAAERAVFLPVDLPLAPAALIGFLLDHAAITGAPVTIASVNGYAQTFPAVVTRAALPALRKELEAGRGGCFAGFQAASASLGEDLRIIPVEPAIQAGQVTHPAGLPAARWFMNVNTPADLRRAGAWHRII
ncbi:MAG: molybdenum cofactor guanylyltransferase [Terracidiphilus sp.]|jgi:molybdopterin-guanine dinucleotide biosynthesis protein A